MTTDGVIRIQGRVLSAQDLTHLQQLLDAHPDWSRYRVALWLCECWNWRTPKGVLKSFAARALLLRLEARHGLRRLRCELRSVRAVLGRWGSLRRNLRRVKAWRSAWMPWRRSNGGWPLRARRCEVGERFAAPPTNGCSGSPAATRIVEWMELWSLREPVNRRTAPRWLRRIRREISRCLLPRRRQPRPAAARMVRHRPPSKFPRFSGCRAAAQRKHARCEAVLSRRINKALSEDA